MIRPLSWVRRHLGLSAELAAYGCWLLIDLVASAGGWGAPAAVMAVGVPLVVLLRRHPRAGLVPTAVVAIGLSLTFSLISTPAARRGGGRPVG